MFKTPEDSSFSLSWCCQWLLILRIAVSKERKIGKTTGPASFLYFLAYSTFYSCSLLERAPVRRLDTRNSATFVLFHFSALWPFSARCTNIVFYAVDLASRLFLLLVSLGIQSRSEMFPPILFWLITITSVLVCTAKAFSFASAYIFSTRDCLTLYFS